MTLSNIELIAAHVKADMDAVCTAHDFFHIQRVLRAVQKIAHAEGGCNMIVVEAGALLHEYFDEKFWDEKDIPQREKNLSALLRDCGISDDDCVHIVHIAHTVGFGKSLTRGNDFVMSKECMIVEDADRLDAMGAIVIARTFAYGGKKGRPIYDPAISPKILTDDVDYRAENNTSLNHFWEKLLLLKDLMHTETGKRLALPKHAYMEKFVEQFLREWNGEE